MSADAWRICPRCKIGAEKKASASVKNLAASYGKIPEPEYLEMKAKIESAKPPEETMREDYEIGMDEDGTLEISYRYSCADGSRLKSSLELTAHTHTYEVHHDASKDDQVANQKTDEARQSGFNRYVWMRRDMVESSV